jgi:phosphoribosylformylglycinamidine cyclo-ligase
MGKYEKRGVSSDKEDVHDAIKKIDKGIFPNAFCKIIPDMFAGDEEFCNIMHADGAGTKTSLAYLHWKETGDLSVWKGVAQDSIVMNLDDLICAGAVNVPLLLSGTIGRNKHLIPGEVLAAIINGTEEFLEDMRNLGIEIYSTGGESADLGDLVRTIVIDNTLSCRMRRDEVITMKIQPGDRIVGLESFGQARYEDAYNSGMGSNGLTSARHDIFTKGYIKKYPETFDPNTDKEVIYCGQYNVTDEVPMKFFSHQPWERPQNVGKFVLSPTRTYAPIIKQTLNTINRATLNGMVHCSGGGQTKVLHFANEIHIVKNTLFDAPPLFQMIQEETKTPWQEMYKVFNMGHRMELYVHSDQTVKEIIDIAHSFNVDAKVVGYVEAAEQKKLTIKSKYGEFIY